MAILSSVFCLLSSTFYLLPSVQREGCGHLLREWIDARGIRRIRGGGDGDAQVRERQQRHASAGGAAAVADDARRPAGDVRAGYRPTERIRRRFAGGQAGWR